MTHAGKPQVWSFAGAAVAAIIGVSAIAGGRFVAGAVGLVIGAVLWRTTSTLNRRDPIPMPHYIRWLLFLPRGPHSPAHLAEVLGPRPGERFLEVGPGPGIHALPIARALLPGGFLDVLDMQPQMLEHLMRSCRRAGIINIKASIGSAEALPYADHLFDAAYMITVLGEIPNQEAAMRELRRVLKPDGRIVIGEAVYDPDYVSISALADLGAATGFGLQEVRGPRLCYFARFRPTMSRGGAYAGCVGPPAPSVIVGHARPDA